MTLVAVAMLTGVVALAIALAVGFGAGPLGRTLGLLDFPDTDGGRKRHARVTPLVGGVAVMLGVTTACALTLWLLPIGPWTQQHLSWLGGVLVAVYLIGFADDRFALGPVVRLVLAIGVLWLAIEFAPDFSLGFLRFSGQTTVWPLGGWGGAFALLCLVGLLNAVNMADGKNGVVLSLGLIWTAVLATRLPPAFLPVLAATGAVLTVLLYFNMRSHLFLGDGGSYTLSTLFGLLAIFAYNNDFAQMRADDVAVMFAIPVFDTIRLMATRRLAGRSPFDGDRDHLHHHLHLRCGWPLGLIVYVALVAVPNFAAVVLPGTGLLWLAVSAACYIITLTLTRLSALPSRAA